MSDSVKGTGLDLERIRRAHDEAVMDGEAFGDFLGPNAAAYDAMAAIPALLAEVERLRAALSAPRVPRCTCPPPDFAYEPHEPSCELAGAPRVETEPVAWIIVSPMLDRMLSWGPEKPATMGQERTFPVYRIPEATDADVGGWRTMDSAPMDGTFVLVATASGMVATMQFCAAGYWRSHVDGRPGIVPIAWQPRPAPPAPVQPGGKVDG